MRIVTAIGRLTNMAQSYSSSATLLAALTVSLVGGCQIAPLRAPVYDEVAAAARPLLTLDPHAFWCDAYNRLVEIGPASVAYLMQQPAMTRRAAPDDLNVLLHTSLIRLLAHPASDPPRLSATCFETTLDLLHFAPQADGRRLGTVVMPDHWPPRSWLDLFPADFDHAAAGTVDLEADRLALQLWWQRNQDRSDGLVTTRRLNPRPAHLWHVLSRRCADRWEYLPEPQAVLCASGAGPPASGLLEMPTYDYNLVRAACIYLGSSDSAEVRRELVELVGSPLPTVSHNARFALRYSRDERIRALLERYPGRP